jgi:hypothetical protein
MERDNVMIEVNGSPEHYKSLRKYAIIVPLSQKKDEWGVPFWVSLHLEWI